jgi:SAM-dependent methyltransferase
MATNPHEQARGFWDRDAATYDDSPTHATSTTLEQAAWNAALVRLLPPAPARVLDVGAGTGFLSLPAARLGHRVTAVDLSTGMLARLRAKAAAEDLDIEVVVAPAEEVPGGFDAVIEHHLVWTLPDPEATIRAWRDAAPSGRLILFESAWGTAATGLESLRATLHRTVKQLRGLPDHHHAPYPADLLAALPHGSGLTPDTLAAHAVAGGWPAVRVERLRDVEWAIAQSRSGFDRVPPVPPRYAVVGG